MNATFEAAPLGEVPSASLPVQGAPPGMSLLKRRQSRLGGTARAAWKFLVGMACTQHPLLSVLLVGWTHRAAQRAVLRRWWKLSDARKQGIAFNPFLASLSQTPGHAHWPNWIMSQHHRAELARAWSRQTPWRSCLLSTIGAFVHSLWLNARLGIQVLFNVLVLTLPGCIFMQFSWRYGWDNSFAKGYEQAFIGPGTGLFGITLFIAAMLYIPLAQARQAATGCWRSFYDVGLIWRLARRRPWGWLSIAVMYFLLSLPANFLKTAPAFLTSSSGEFAERLARMLPEEAVAWLRGYYFWSAAYVFPAFVLLRITAARVYATSLLAEIRHGCSLPALSLGEHEALSRLGLLQRRAPQRMLLVRAVRWTTSRTLAVASVILAVVVWFSVIAQTYVSEFLNYHTQFGQAWLNQPLVQLPYFRYLPDHGGESL